MSQSKKSNTKPNTYVVVSSCPMDDKHDHLRFLGTFADPVAIGPFLTAGSSGNQTFQGEDHIASLAVGESSNTPFGSVTITVTALRTDGRTKAIYCQATGAAQTSKPKGASLTLLRCPVCGDWAEPADDDGHCSYECASGG